MLVGQVMATPAVVVQEQATVEEAIELLERHDVTGMPVVDGNGELVGVLTESDVIRETVVADSHSPGSQVRLSAAPFRARVADVMSTRPLTVSSGTDLSVAADLMTSTVVKSLPVVDSGAVVGVISRRDIIRVLSRRDALIQSELADLLRREARDWLVTVEDGVVTVDVPGYEVERRDVETLLGSVHGVIGVHIRRSPSAEHTR